MSAPDQAQIARAAERDARLAVEAIKRAAKQAGEEARAAAEQSYLAEHDYAGARDRLSSAIAARIEAEDALPDHPWEGRRVFRMENVGPPWAQQTKRVDGVVETFRSRSPLPANTGSWSAPDIGEAVVRFLKKNGSPGLKFEKLERPWGSKWELADTKAPEQSA